VPGRKKDILSVVSLFTGAGGLDVGLGRSQKFDLRACVELQPTYCDTLTINRDLEAYAKLSLKK
jgi:DNA (cytosine-5)-methyltransferase 1